MALGFQKRIGEKYGLMSYFYTYFPILGGARYTKTLLAILYMTTKYKYVLTVV